MKTNAETGIKCAFRVSSGSSDQSDPTSMVETRTIFLFSKILKARLARYSSDIFFFNYFLLIFLLQYSVM